MPGSRRSTSAKSGSRSSRASSARSSISSTSSFQSSRSTCNGDGQNIDRLSLFMAKIANEKGTPLQQEQERNAQRVEKIIQKIIACVFLTEVDFLRTFDLPPDLKNPRADGVTLSETNYGEFTCRIFLKRCIFPDGFYMDTGPDADVPPGVAIYRLNKKLLNREEISIVKGDWGHIMTEDGVISPAMIYPWFASGLMNAISILARGKGEETSTNGSTSSESSEDHTQEKNPFEGIRMVTKFPGLKVILPQEDEEQEDRHSDIGHLTDEEEERKEPEGEYVTKTDEKEDFQWRERRRKKENGDDVGEVDGEGEASFGSRRHRRQSGNVNGLSEQKVLEESKRKDKKKSENKDSDDESSIVMQKLKDPIVIHIVPAIIGLGWPRGLKLQHALPKMQPYCYPGLECLKLIEDKIIDGQSLWYATAKDIDLTKRCTSARFRGTIRKVGRGENYWSVCVKPAEALITMNLVSTARRSNPLVNLGKVQQVLLAIKHEKTITTLSPTVIDACILWVMKKHMTTLRTIGQCCLKCIEFLKQVAESRSCPGFLMPNVNIAASMDVNEAERLSKELDKLLRKTRENPAYVLKYVGYPQRKKEQT